MRPKVVIEPLPAYSLKWHRAGAEGPYMAELPAAPPASSANSPQAKPIWAALVEAANAAVPGPPSSVGASTPPPSPSAPMPSSSPNRLASVQAGNLLASLAPSPTPTPAPAGLPQTYTATVAPPALAPLPVPPQAAAPARRVLPTNALSFPASTGPGRAPSPASRPSSPAEAAAPGPRPHGASRAPENHNNDILPEKPKGRLRLRLR